MQYHFRIMKRLLLTFVLLSPLMAFANLAVVANAPTQIRLRIGATGATVSQASVTVAGGNVGDSTVQLTTAPLSAGGGSLCGADFVFFNAEAREAPSGSRTATLTANSSAGMACITAATCGTDNIAFTQIDWINTPPGAYAPATIGAGAFTGGAAQPIITFNNSQQSQDCLRFRYLNQNIVRQGTYRGDITFTLVMP